MDDVTDAVTGPHRGQPILTAGVPLGLGAGGNGDGAWAWGFG